MNKKSLKAIILVCLVSLFICALPNFLIASDKEDELFFVAQKAFEDGFYDVALRYLEKFLKDFPETDKRPQVNLLIGQCYFFDSQYLKAFDQFQTLLNSPEARDIKDAVFFWMGETYLKGKDYKQAQNLYQQLINEFPKSNYLSQAYYSLGWTFFDEGKFKQSIEYFRKLTEIFKQSDLVEDASFKIGECLFNLKEFGDANKQFGQYLSNYPNSQKQDLAYFYIAESNYYLDNFDVALENYTKVVSIAQDDKLKNLARISSGWTFLKIKKYEESLSNFNEAESVAREKGLPADDILLGKGNLFAEMDKNDKAMVFYEELINNYPNSVRIYDAYLGKANALYGLAKYKESAEAYKTVINKYPDFGNSDLGEKAYFGLGWANLKMRNLPEAIENFKFVANNSKDHLMRLSAFCQLADTYQDTGELSRSQEIYDKILKDYPDSPYTDYVQYQQGIVLLKMDKIDAATLMFQSLKTNFPKSKFISDAQYYLGTAYFKKGDFASCVEQFGSLIKTLPRENELRPEAMLNLGLSYGHLEKHRQAIEIFERIAKEYPLSSDLIQRAEFEIANTMFIQGKVKDSLKKFKIIAYKYPKTKIGIQAINWLGDYYFKDRKFDISGKYFTQILEEFPNGDMADEAHYKLARVLIEMGKFSQAEKELDKVNTSARGQLIVETKFAKVAILAKTDWQSAVKAYEQLGKEYPNFAKSICIRLAQVYKSMNNLERAISYFQLSLAKPDDSLVEMIDAQLQFDIADLQETRGDLNKAIESYLKIPYVYPQENILVVKSYLRVARIFEDKNDWKEAKKIYEKIVSQDVDEAKFAQERLDWINRNLKN